MTENDIATGHLPPARADAARHAAGVLLEAARGWAAATKRQVGAVAVPDDPAAARAFDAFYAARRELARHLGGPAACRVGADALTMASSASATA